MYYNIICLESIKSCCYSVIVMSSLDILKAIAIRNVTFQLRHEPIPDDYKKLVYNTFLKEELESLQVRTHLRAKAKSSDAARFLDYLFLYDVWPIEAGGNSLEYLVPSYLKDTFIRMVNNISEMSMVDWDGNTRQVTLCTSVLDVEPAKKVPLHENIMVLW